MSWIAALAPVAVVLPLLGAAGTFLLRRHAVAQRIISHTYRTFEVFICAAAIYLVLNFIIIRLLGLLEHRISPHLRARPRSSVPGAPPEHAAGPIQLPEVPR